MKKSSWIVLVVLAGCTASTNGAVQTSTTPAAAVTVDGKRALNPLTKKCEMRRGASQEDLAACLESEVAALEGKKPRPPAPPARAVAPDGSCTRDFGASTEQYIQCLQWRKGQLAGDQANSATVAAAPAATGSQQPVPAIAPVADNGTFYIPGAAGAVCETNTLVQLTVKNDSQYVWSARTFRPSGQKGPDAIVPLHCDAPLNLMPLMVVNHDGTTETVLVIPPGATARYVFLPFNGGLGKANVEFRKYLWNRVTPGQPQVPSQEVGNKVIRYTVPYDGGNEQALF